METFNNGEFKALLKFAKENEDFHRSGWESDVCLSRTYFLGRVEVAYNGEGSIGGYCETWRLTFSQVKRILNDEHFDILSENLTDGPVLWFANVSVLPSFKDKFQIIRDVKRKIFMKNSDAKFVGGEYMGTRKRNKKYKILRFKNGKLSRNN